MNKLVCAAASLTLLLLTACHAAKPDGMSPKADAGASRMTSVSTSWTSIGEALFSQVKGLIGMWDAPTRQGVMTDISKRFAIGKAVLAEEWIIAKKITSTVLYVVDSGLRADHDTRAIHFHRTKQRFVDNQYLQQTVARSPEKDRYFETASAWNLPRYGADRMHQ